VSFELMRRRGLEVALALDRDFVSAGFRILP
jgi:predicted nucleic acid-binding protein